MKRIFVIICLTFSGLCLSACREEAPFAEETKELSRFLQDNFRVQMADKGVYLFVPSCQCKYCVRLDAYHLLSEQARNQFYLVCSLDTVYFRNFSNTFYDAEDKVMKLSFLEYTNQLVLVKNKRIQGIVRVRNFEKQIDSVARFFLDEGSPEAEQTL